MKQQIGRLGLESLFTVVLCGYDQFDGFLANFLGNAIESIAEQL